MPRILVVGPHPDDQELGMGAAVAMLAGQGHDILLLDVTNGEPTPYGDPETRAKEAAAAAKILAPASGNGSVTRMLLGLPNRTVEHTIEARHAVAAVIRAHQADIIFTPYFEDAHPDHRAVTRIVEDARFDAKLSKLDLADPVDQWTGAKLALGDPLYPKWLFYYYATHLRWVPDPSFILDVTGYVERKIESIKAYHTQFVLPEKNRGVVEWVEASARYFGSRIGTGAGECFFTKEPLGLRGLGALAQLP
ncbi:MAG: PIG-L deacetylase family protein [Phycisphaerales bacterium JB039]